MLAGTDPVGKSAAIRTAQVFRIIEWITEDVKREKTKFADILVFRVASSSLL